MIFALYLQSLILIFLVIYTIAYFFYAFFYFIFPLFYCGAFFAKIDKSSLDNMIKLADIKPGDIFLDLGSGDGKIVIAGAKAGATAYGFEINPFLVKLSQKNIIKNKLEGRAFILKKDFWKEDLSKYNIITLFGIKFMMSRLEEKIKKEAKPGTKILSKYFTFPGLKPKSTLGLINLYEIK